MKHKSMYKIGVALLILSVILIVYIWNAYDYNQDDFLTALETGEDVRGKKVYFEVESMNEEVLTGWTMTSTNGITFVNGVAQDVRPGEMVTVEVNDFGNVFGSWIVTYYNN